MYSYQMQLLSPILKREVSTQSVGNPRDQEKFSFQAIGDVERTPKLVATECALLKLEISPSPMTLVQTR